MLRGTREDLVPQVRACGAVGAQLSSRLIVARLVPVLGLLVLLRVLLRRRASAWEAGPAAAAAAFAFAFAFAAASGVASSAIAAAAVVAAAVVAAAAAAAAAVAVMRRRLAVEPPIERVGNSYP